MKMPAGSVQLAAAEVIQHIGAAAPQTSLKELAVRERMAGIASCDSIAIGNFRSAFMPGLVPGIHVFLQRGTAPKRPDGLGLSPARDKM